MIRAIETGAETTVEPKEALDERTSRDRRRLRRWLVLGAATVLVFGAGLALKARIWNRAPAPRTRGSIDWRLSVLSDNRVEFRPTLTLFSQAPRRPPGGA